MERLYRKVEKGRRTVYEEYGFGGVPDLVEGVWLVQKHKSGGSQTSLIWRVGDLKRPVDVVTHVALMSMEQELVRYLMNLSDVKSEEYKEAKDMLGGYLSHPPVYNISASDICSLFLREIAKKLEQGVIIDWGKLMMDFRDKTKQHVKSDFNKRVEVLWEFIDFIKESGYELKQKKL